jgi:hypothetical protein
MVPEPRTVDESLSLSHAATTQSANTSTAHTALAAVANGAIVILLVTHHRNASVEFTLPPHRQPAPGSMVDRLASGCRRPSMRQGPPFEWLMSEQISDPV